MLMFERPESYVFREPPDIVDHAPRATKVTRAITTGVVVGLLALGALAYSPPDQLDGTRWERIAEATERCDVHRVGSPQYITCRATAAETP